MNATRELLAKEVRLQRSNAMFALAIVLLGAIAMIAARGAGPEIAGFSTDEIKAGLFATVILPVLCGILPLMIGSTAAAAEKALGVWPWQAALPVTRRRLIMTKALVATGSIFIVAGVLPYLLELLIPDETMIYFVFRATWPGWVGLLCGGIGFYAGALARDDYQGLLVSVLPLLGIVFIMGIADPLMLVFPVQPYKGVFWFQWALALRLILIAAAFVLCAARFIGRTAQRPWRWVALHAMLVAAVVFSLTLWNVVTERSLLVQPSPSYHQTDLWPTDTRTVNFTVPSTLAGLKRPPPEMAWKQVDSDFGYITMMGEADHRVAIGSVMRYNARGRLNDDRRSNHPYLVTQYHQVHEFPQAGEGEIIGWTDNGRWICVMSGERFLICGPLGIAIRSDWLPYSIFEKLRVSMHFNEAPGEDRTLPMLGSKRVGVPENTGLTMQDGKPVFVDNGIQRDAGYTKSDLILQPQPMTGIIWKDGRDKIPEKLRRNGFLARQSTEPDAATASLINDAGVTVTAVLKPSGQPFQYELAGWVKGDFAWTSDDYSVALSAVYGKSLYLITHLDPKLSANDVGTSSAREHTWQISSERTMADGSTMTLSKFSQFDVTNIGGEKYTRLQYKKTASVSFGNRKVDGSFPFETGIVVVSLETGKETIVPVPLPWPAAVSMSLQGAVPIAMQTTYRMERPSANGNDTGRLVLTRNGRAAVVTIEGKAGNWSTRIDYAATYLPGMNSNGGFLNNDAYIFNDQNNLMILNLDRPQLP